jgi:glutathione synthase
MKKSQRGYTTTKMSDVWVLFIIEENERNLGDQKCLESELYDRQGIKTLRATFAEVWRSYEIDPATRVLRVQGREIGLVYYRTGYQYE